MIIKPTHWYGVLTTVVVVGIGGYLTYNYFIKPRATKGIAPVGGGGGIASPIQERMAAPDPTDPKYTAWLALQEKLKRVVASPVVDNSKITEAVPVQQNTSTSFNGKYM